MIKCCAKMLKASVLVRYSSIFREEDEETDTWLALLLKIACNV